MFRRAELAVQLALTSLKHRSAKRWSGAKPLQHQPIKIDSAQAELGCTRQVGARAEVSLLCEVRMGGGAWKTARLDDISQAGFRVAWLPGATKDTSLRVRIRGLQVLSAHVRWQQDNAIGCEFAEPLHVAVFEHIVRQCAVG
jgi:hypothetical protein